MRPVTVEKFLTRSREAHGDRYEYDVASYSQAKNPVRIKCAEHGWFEQEAGRHMRGAGCRKCADVLISINRAGTLDNFLSKSREVHGDKYDYSRAVYKRSNIKVTIICPDHGEFDQLPNTHMQGSGCPACGRYRSIESRSLGFDEFVARSREVHGDRFEYAKGSYVNMNTNATIICKHHGEFKQLPRDHSRGHGCPVCHMESIGRWNTTPLESFVEKANAVHGNRFTYSDYTKASSMVTITCPEHGPFPQIGTSHLQGIGCPRCWKTGPTRWHVGISDFLSEHTEVELESKLDGAMGRKRLDIYLPEYKLAVECHGLIWHSTRFAKGTRDYEKHKIAEAAGVRVIHIYEDEWEAKPEVVKRVLLSAIGKLPKIGARQTKVVEVYHKTAAAFYDANHLQGAARGRVHLALTQNNRIVACMSFTVLRSVRNNTDESAWELVRYAASCTVVGGASKLLKAFADMGLARTITSYADLRAFSGKMYERLGFKLTHITAPDYMYTNGNIVIGRRHKSNFQKARLGKMFNLTDEEVAQYSEREITEANGWYRIYDCGKARYDLEVEKPAQGGLYD